MNLSTTSKVTKQKREIKTCADRVFAINTADLGDSVSDWLVKQAGDYPELKLRWLLAHADDGVIWGRLEEGKLLTSADSSKSFLPALRHATLRDARIFSPKGELMLWRIEEGEFAASMTCENAESAEQKKNIEYTECIDEGWLLWGDQGKQLVNNFTLWTEGKRGIKHAVPMKSTLPPILEVRQYLANDDCARLAGGRLLDVVPEKNEKGDYDVSSN